MASDQGSERSDDFGTIRIGTFTTKPMDLSMQQYWAALYGFSATERRFEFGNDPDQRWTVTITLHFFYVRRRLAYLSPLIRRPRGRRMLRVRLFQRVLTFRNVKIEPENLNR